MARSLKITVLAILVAIFSFVLPQKSYAACDSVHVVALWEVDHASDVIFCGRHQPEFGSYIVEKVYKGHLTVGEKISVQYPDPPISYISLNFPITGAFGSPRQDGLVAANYKQVEGNEKLVTAKLPAHSCTAAPFTPTDMNLYFSGPFNLVRLKAFAQDHAFFLPPDRPYPRCVPGLITMAALLLLIASIVFGIITIARRLFRSRI